MCLPSVLFQNMDFSCITRDTLSFLNLDFTNKQIRKERPEDLDVPAALADFIHQQRTQEHVEDMYVSSGV